MNDSEEAQAEIIYGSSEKLPLLKNFFNIAKLFILFSVFFALHILCDMAAFSMILDILSRTYLFSLNYDYSNSIGDVENENDPLESEYLFYLHVLTEPVACARPSVSLLRAPSKVQYIVKSFQSFFY